ncbi:MAG: hypothetical protein B6241_10940 [Spirochaetaceae bacterium 4572_59]|nr:MAG: hypothetical protein B6241_10940 [Spirochaetaceae bacterium 4572_59]
MYNVLLIEDSDSIREAVENYLILNDYSVTSCRNLQEAESSLNTNLPDLAVVDVNLPDGNGFLFARKVLSKTTVPFLFLTSRSEESDRITGLELGASDYIVKPFSLKEMILRIEAIKKRTESTIPGQELDRNCWKLNDNILEIDQNSHRVSLDGNALKLTPTEWEILSKLISHNGSILSREQIQKSLWNISDEKSLKTIDSHIKNIRNKLKSPHWIEAVRGFGFRFTGDNRNG